MKLKAQICCEPALCARGVPSTDTAGRGHFFGVTKRSESKAHAHTCMRLYLPLSTPPPPPQRNDLHSRLFHFAAECRAALYLNRWRAHMARRPQFASPAFPGTSTLLMLHSAVRYKTSLRTSVRTHTANYHRLVGVPQMWYKRTVSAFPRRVSKRPWSPRRRRDEGGVDRRGAQSIVTNLHVSRTIGHDTGHRHLRTPYQKANTQNIRHSCPLICERLARDPCRHHCRSLATGF